MENAPPKLALLIGIVALATVLAKGIFDHWEDFFPKPKTVTEVVNTRTPIPASAPAPLPSATTASASIKQGAQVQLHSSTPEVIDDSEFTTAFNRIINAGSNHFQRIRKDGSHTEGYDSETWLSTLKLPGFPTAMVWYAPSNKEYYWKSRTSSKSLAEAQAVLQQTLDLIKSCLGSDWRESSTTEDSFHFRHRSKGLVSISVIRASEFDRDKAQIDVTFYPND